MNNRYDEIKKLLDSSRKMLGKENISEARENLINKGLIVEGEFNFKDNGYETAPEGEEEPSPKDKKKSYRISGGVLTFHGKSQKDLTLSTDDKMAFQETMDDFVSDVSDLSDFGVLNVYPNNVDWSGKVIDFDLEFYFSIGENSGVYINGDMIKLDNDLVELINKLTTFYEKFKSKWAKVLAQRKKTMTSED
jgi:hypothetical protein